jgi:putative DNA methylase
MRGIAMMWNWTDENVFMRFTGSWIRNLETLSESLEYFSKANSKRSIMSNNDAKATDVWLDDATVLSKLSNEKFDLIVTDPPYYDDVPYAELSDFYYVWLKRALSDVEDGKLVPRFLPEAFFDRIGEDWIEVSTRWEKYALSEVSLNPPRLGAGVSRENGIAHFQNLLNSSFVTMASRLKDDGILVTYYAHTSPEAWKALLKAGWESAGFRVTNAFPIATESAQSVVSRGKLSMDTSIVVVWRKTTSEETIDASKLYDRMVEVAAERARELIEAGWIGRDLVIGTLAAALSVATKYREVRVMGRIDTDTLVEKYVYPAAYLGLARAYARKAELRDGIRSSEAMFLSYWLRQHCQERNRRFLRALTFESFLLELLWMFGKRLKRGSFCLVGRREARGLRRRRPWFLLNPHLRREAPSPNCSRYVM